MSTITNNAGLPAALVAAVRNDFYDGGNCDISVTRLIQPPRKVALEKLHADEIIEDASERVWALMGQLGHSVLERSGVGLVEHRLYSNVRGWKVSGKADVIASEHKLIDWKFTSVWSAKDGAKSEWIEQLNLLDYLCRHNGIDNNALEVTCIYRDWSKLEARRNGDYPRNQVQVFSLPLWTQEQQSQFIQQRVQLHQSAQSALEKNLPECTPEERWQKPTKYALMKHGRERAVKLFDDAQIARDAFEKADGGHYLQERPGEQVRCQSYCNALPWCSLAKSLGVNYNPSQP